MASTRSSTPDSFSIVTGLNPRATHDASYACTHCAWNASGSATATTTAGRPCTTRNPDLSTVHAFFAPENSR